MKLVGRHGGVWEGDSEDGYGQSIMNKRKKVSIKI